MWHIPDHAKFVAIQKVAYSYDRGQTPGLPSYVNKAIQKAIPQVEALLKRATKVTYRYTNGSHRHNHMYYYFAPRFSTDYLVLETDVLPSEEIMLSLSWVPYVPGTTELDFGSMIQHKMKVKVAQLIVPYVIQLTKKMANEMPHLEKVASKVSVNYRRAQPL